MVSEIVETGETTVVLSQNKYVAGDTVTIQYRHGATYEDCEAASYNAYSTSFTSLGFVQIKIISTL